MIITIDGPTASGKSSVAAALAGKLGYAHLNSGLLYRAFAWVLFYKYNCVHDPLENNQEKLNTTICSKNIIEYIAAHLVYKTNKKRSSVSYEHQDITNQLKNPTIDRIASIISVEKIIREQLTKFQRTYAQHHDIVIDGRDAGSVVFPYANVKFFLTATPDVRAERWRHATAHATEHYTHEQAVTEILKRDERDMTRTISPLIVPKDAHIIDSSTLTFEQVLHHCCALISDSKNVNQEIF